MPFLAVPLIAGAVGYAFGSSILINFAISAVIGGLAQALAKKPAQPDQSASGTSSFASQGRNLTLTQPVSPWQIVLGEVRTGGVVTFAFLDSARAYFHMVVTLACHPCDGMEELILNGEPIGPQNIDADGLVLDGNWGGYTFPTETETFTVPGSPWQVSVAHDVWSVQSVTHAVNATDVNGESVSTSVELTLVSGTPDEGQYARSGNTFTFASIDEANVATINYTHRETDSKCRMKFADGTETGQPFPDLVAESEGRWTDAHRQSGHCKLYLRFPTAAIIGGVPQISTVLRGLKPYDPRTASSAWSFNPALLLGEYMTDDEFGFAADSGTDIDTDTQEAAANVCEERVLATDAGVLFTCDGTAVSYLTLTGPAAGGAVLDLNATSGAPIRTPRTGDGVRLTTTGTLPAGLSLATTYYVIRQSAGLIQLATSFANAMARAAAVTITDAGSGTHTLTLYDEPRYTANGTFLTSQARAELVDLLTHAMAGRMAPIGEAWLMHAGAYDAPTVTLGEREIVGAVRIDPAPATQDAANGVRGVFVDTANNFTATDFPAVTDAAYLSADNGERLWADLDFTGLVTSGPTAQRLAKIELRRRRYAMTVTATFRLSAWRALTARTVALDFAKYGWEGQEFEVAQSRFMVLDEGEGPTLGVELTLRQSDSAIWDWSLSEQQVQAAVRNTSLPSPFDIAEPGVPTVTEELYQTSGSAGVKTRALLEWNAGDSQQPARYELRYKRAEDAAYTQPPSLPGNSPAAQVDDLAAGLFLFGIRAVNSLGTASAWVTATKPLQGLTAPPGDVDNFTVLASNGFALASWNLATDLDVRIGGRVQIRWSPTSTGQEWEDGWVLEEFNGDAVQGLLPLRAGTYMAKFRDSTGNFSEDAATFAATEGMVTGFNTVGSRDIQAAGFPGDYDNTYTDGALLKLDSASTIGEMTALISTWPKISSLGGISGSGSYRDSAYVDCSTAAVRRWELSAKSLSYDTDDTIAQRTDPISTWNSISGDAVNDCDMTPLVSITNDNPAGSPVSWSAYVPMVVADLNCRAARFGLDLVSGNPTHNIQVTAFSVAAKEPA